MAKVTVLGGCGAVGSVAVRKCAESPVFSEVVIADANEKRAASLAKEIGPKVSTVTFDALNADSVKKAIKGSDVVLNCVGPFYSTVKTILKAVLELKINYVDVCDDVDVTLDILDWDKQAKDAGVCALIGMGSSPGVTNIIARMAADVFLDETTSIDIFHAHGGEPFEGEGVIGHRFHCMSIDCPMYLDGELKYVKYFREDGIALRERFTFPILGDVLLYPYPHPEQVTIPRYIKLKQVTNKGTVIPEAYYNLTRDLCGLGLGNRTPLDVKGQKVVPYDFAVAYIIRERERLIKEAGLSQQCGCVSVIAKGKKDGKYKEYRVHIASASQALGEGTGIPAAMGAILMGQGKIASKGVFPPEACVNPNDFMTLLPQVMTLDKKKEGGSSFGGLIVESVDENGKVTKIDL